MSFLVVNDEAPLFICEDLVISSSINQFKIEY